MQNHSDVFNQHFREWVERTCLNWEYSVPEEKYYEDAYKRLPYGLRSIIGYGISNDLLLDAGESKTGSAGFRPKGVPDDKGPYSWLERDNNHKLPRPAWEYYVQVAEYIRLLETLSGKDYSLAYEDDLMDIAIYKNDTIFICCEIKVTSKQSNSLINKIVAYETATTLPSEDRGMDEFRKAKYIVKHRPDYFYVVSIGRRYEYRIEYPKDMQFKLVEDVIPFI